MNARIFGVEVADELRAIFREPTALFFSIVMPVGFFALFVSLYGRIPAGPVPAGTGMLATFGTFAVLSVSLTNPGITVAGDRERGWLRAKRVSAVPIGVTLAAKLVAVLPYSAGVLLAMTATAALTGSLNVSVVELLRVFAVLILGVLPFALLGLAVGFQAGSNATAAILNAFLFPSAVLSGLWMPLEILPAFFGHIAQFLPTYHLSQLALAQLAGEAAAVHALVLLGATAVTAALAAMSYRHARS
ncbi:ABC transporter permease [Saccharopolyspora elongata]|uniref:ABC transporter permease n=1 Tax=Saccharopolyspora elongata TaxID=2530387 RepID=A0A4R4Z1U3_9PSEU|nr:ABC transporter permease [Saccharopolyspora elongata]TDD51736.1 ABC transporter permease [Saccharopolyspora elongata]